MTKPSLTPSANLPHLRLEARGLLQTERDGTVVTRSIAARSQSSTLAEGDVVSVEKEIR